jgi:AcrR family transcriptional regulator
MTAARALFAERGYAAVSADEIVSAAGLTRGALHHHFGDKAGLFRAVLEQLDAELTAEVAQAVADVPDTAGQMVVALRVFLDLCQRPEVVRISLTDAPSVLGWDTWREIEAQHALGLIKDMIENGVAAGMITPQPVEVLAQLVLSVTIEAALMVVHAKDQAATRQAVEPALITMLSGLLRN